MLTLPLYSLPRPCKQGREGRNLLRSGLRKPCVASVIEPKPEKRVGLKRVGLKRVVLKSCAFLCLQTDFDY